MNQTQKLQQQMKKQQEIREGKMKTLNNFREKSDKKENENGKNN